MKIIHLLGCVALCEGVGVLAGAITSQSVKVWYPELAKRWFTPPAWVFGPAWILLYLLMGISLCIVWRSDAGSVRFALIAFFTQLALNAAWSFIFFGFRSPFWGFVEIVLLVGAIIWTMVLFFRISLVAGSLLIPYLLWVLFATMLTFSIWRLNPT